MDSIPGAYYYSWNWTVTPPYSANCRIKVVANDVAGNSAWDVSNHDFSISASGNNNPVIYGKIHMKCNPSEQCTLCIHYGDTITLEVHTSDPDGDSVFYDWSCGHGHFLNGQHSITTPLNSVTYIAPAYFDDYISVAVNDVRGGQSIISGDIEINPSGYSCLCGDATADSVIDMGDIVYLINYLYKNGPEPLSPKNRGDANNSCIIEIGDVITIISYLFKSGPPPICCWIYQ